MDERSPSDPARSDASTSGTPATGAPPTEASGTTGTARESAAEPSAATSDPPGLREQIGSTRGAAMRLVRAHMDLARAELGEIMDEVKRMAAYVGAALALVLFVAVLLPIGLTLWFGEWVFGSMGWGVLHGTELCIAFAIALVVVAIGRPAARVAGLFVLGAIVAIVVAVGFAFNVPNELFRRLADAAFTGIDPAWRSLVEVIAVAIALGIVGLVLGALAGSGAAGAFGLFAFGLVLACLSAFHFEAGAAAGLGVAVGLVVWPALVGYDAFRSGIDVDSLKARFMPNETIDTVKETIEWARTQSPIGPKA